MTIRCAALLTLIGTLVPAQAQELHLWAVELKPVFTVLQQAHLSGRMELSGRCDPAHLPGFPQFKGANAQESSFLKALREVAISDPAMRVRQDAVGTIWMQEKGVPHDVLKIRIARVLFEDYGHNDVYSANAALEAVLRAPEVITYAKMHNIAVSPSPTETRAITGPSGRPHWPPGSPHMSGSIYNVTVLEALDQIQRTFSGEVLVYWNCPETQDKNEPKRMTNHHKQKEESGPSSNCLASSTGETQSAVFPAGVPNPFCIPQSALSGLPQLFPTQPEPSHQRRAFFHFFSMKKGYGEKMLVVSG
jgi:hypothetical protein